MNSLHLNPNFKSMNSWMVHTFFDVVNTQAKFQAEQFKNVSALVNPQGAALLEPFVQNTKAVLGSALAAPFEATKSQYISAVQAGLIESSMLGSQKMANALNAVESLTLGPLARSRY